MGYLKYPEKDLFKLQKAEKEIIRDIHAVCKKYDIRYFAMFGTLLGAVRHHDFIPWDDDVDLSMLREDYERFLKIFDAELGSKYAISSPETKNQYYSFVPKVYLKNTVFQTELAKRSGIDQIGIFVEIFVLDDVSKSVEVRQKQIQAVDHLKPLLLSNVVKHPYTEKGNVFVRGTKTFAKYVLHAWTNMTGITPEKLNKKYVDLVDQHLNTGKLIYFCDDVTKDAYIEKKNLFPLQEVAFGEDKINIPNNYKYLLEKEYGDYMILPPEDQRWNQAPVKIIFQDGETAEYKQH